MNRINFQVVKIVFKGFFKDGKGDLIIKLKIYVQIAQTLTYTLKEGDGPKQNFQTIKNLTRMT